MNSKAVHLTTVHSISDPRIFHKEMQALKQGGYDVTLVAHHQSDENLDGVQIKSLGSVDTRLERWKNLPEAYKVAKELEADVYHFHDPELLPVGIALTKRTSGKVIYDIHENYAAKIPRRPWIPSVLRPIASQGFPILQQSVINQFDAVVTATDWIAESLNGNKVEHVVPIRNFPLTDEIEIADEEPVDSDHDYIMVYAGGLRKNRGLFQMADLLDGLREQGLDVGLWLIGTFQSDTDEEQFRTVVQTQGLEEHVRTFGWIDYTDLFSYLAQADLGLAILDPEDCVGAIPTKMFDYMYSNTPVIASEMAATRQYLPSDCGTVVPYGDTEAQIEAVERILMDETAENLGSDGRTYIEEKYSWKNEKTRLLDLYSSLT